jgi:3-deoxy-7-phosphoheptulonate synthase
MAGVAVGSDGLMIEVHPQPDRALSDGAQSLTPESFEQLVEQIRPLAEVVGKPLPSSGGRKAPGGLWEP